MPHPNETMQRLRSMERFQPDETIKPAKTFNPNKEQLDRIESKLDTLITEIQALKTEQRLTGIDFRLAFPPKVSDEAVKFRLDELVRATLA